MRFSRILLLACATASCQPTSKSAPVADAVSSPASASPDDASGSPLPRGAAPPADSGARPSTVRELEARTTGVVIEWTDHTSATKTDELAVVFDGLGRDQRFDQGFGVKCAMGRPSLTFVGADGGILGRLLLCGENGSIANWRSPSAPEMGGEVHMKDEDAIAYFYARGPVASTADAAGLRVEMHLDANGHALRELPVWFTVRNGDSRARRVLAQVLTSGSLALEVRRPSGARVLPLSPPVPLAGSAGWMTIAPGDSARFRCSPGIGGDVEPGRYAIRFRGVETDLGPVPPSEAVIAEITH